MAAKIGILGESTVGTAGSQTVYTVPADKAARVQVLMFIEMSSSQSVVDVKIGCPGTERTWNYNQLAGSVDAWTGLEYDNTNDNLLMSDPGKSDSSLYGAAYGEGQHQLIGKNLDGAGPDNSGYVLHPYPRDYFLSTGDTVTATYVGNAVDTLVQVQGVEDDA